MEKFKETIEQCQLDDLGFSRAWFTWERGNFQHTNVRE